MKTILAIIIILFTSFSHDYRQKWYCHTSIRHGNEETCVLRIAIADNKFTADSLFDVEVKRLLDSLHGKEVPVTHVVVKTPEIKILKDAIMIEP